MEQNKISRRSFLQYVLASWVSASLGNLTSVFIQGATPDAIAGDVASTPMDAGRPSATAQGAAILRAAHQILDKPLIFDDPIALRIIGTRTELALRSNPERFNTHRYLRAFIVFRSRYAEDELARAVMRGTCQYVILGAGLDTFPYRNPYPESSLRVFEVDHPATQSWKRQRLGESGIATPDSLVFVPIDFERQTLADGLKKTGFRAEQPSFFSWLGVVVYLTKPAVMETFKFVASLPVGSEIVFDYSVPPSLLTEKQRSAREAGAKRVATIGEPWITYLDPPSFKSELQEMGFRHVEDLSPEEANERYFKNRADGLRLGGAGRLMKARVG
jgi:methyltransferase (TIGR00027 family)